jgi:hypothetical protein
LEYNGFWPEVFHDFSKNRSGNGNKRFVIHTLIKREVDSPVSAFFFSDIFDVASTWEIVFELMEGAGHDSVSEVKGFFDTVTMMDIDINIEDSLVCFEEF